MDAEQKAGNPVAESSLPLIKVLLVNFVLMAIRLKLRDWGYGVHRLFPNPNPTTLTPNGRMIDVSAGIVGEFTIIWVQIGLNILIGLILIFRPRTKRVGMAILLAGLIMALIGLGCCALMLASIHG
jgi:hypothetical protein